MTIEELQAEVSHLRRRLAEAATLLEALANSDMRFCNSNGAMECQWCNASCLSVHIMLPSEHDKDCPIRLASEWLQV